MSEKQDVRLLVPGLAAWALVALTLAWPATARTAGGAALLLVAGLVLAGPGRSRSTRRGRHALLARGAAASAFALTAAAAGVTLAASGAHGLERSAGPVAALAEQGASVSVTGRVVADPRVLPGRSGTVLLRLDLRSVERGGRRSRVRTSVLVLARGSWASLRWGERVVGHGRLAPAAAADDVLATFTARGPPTVVARAPWLDRGAERVRTGLRRAVRSLPADARGLLPGLVVGDTALQPPELTDAMRVTGLTHLAAVSGTNTTLVCALALGLCRGLGLGRRLRLVVAAALLAGFVVLARPEPSVLRAAVMGAIGLLALGTARRRLAVPALSAAVVGLLVADPWLARSYGFALSVLATLGLLLLAPSLQGRLQRRLPRALATALAVPVAAQAACTPVIVLLAGQVSVMAVPANLLAEPLVAPATVLGLAAALTGAVWPQAAVVLAWGGGLPCVVIGAVARTLSRWPHAQVPWPGGATGAGAIALLLVAAWVAGPRLWAWSVAHRRLAASGGALLLAVGAPLPTAVAWPPHGWVLVVCDVGQGDALVIATGPGRAVLVDAGPDAHAVDRCLTDLRVRALDLVVLTHFHADHVDGLPGALRGRRVGGLGTTIVGDPPAQARQVRRLAARAGLPVRAAVVGERAHDGPVSWQVLWPERVIRAGSVPNNASVVLDVRVAGLRLLLVGDVEPEAARALDSRLRALPDGPRVDVLKVAHHGSARQDERLLADTAPTLALVSVGADNDYGHPAAALLRRLAGQGAVVARTDLSGDLAVVASGPPGARRPSLATSGPHPEAVGGRR
ncbi:MAG TPA: ComEC/Rec2 family competence protein [Angustibacter sp.]|nr:ComEC/Rec2 family competence protein [Angustibacter sp.]